MACLVRDIETPIEEVIPNIDNEPRSTEVFVDIWSLVTVGTATDPGAQQAGFVRELDDNLVDVVEEVFVLAIVENV